MADIYVGDNGIVIEVSLFDSVGVVQLHNVTAITALFVRGDRSTFEKTFSVDDPAAGVCSSELMSEDLSVPGDYFFQVTATFTGDKEYTGTNQRFKVKPRLTAGNAGRN